MGQLTMYGKSNCCIKVRIITVVCIYIYIYIDMEIPEGNGDVNVKKTGPP